MDDDVKQKILEAGRINASARELARERATPGTKLVTIAEEVEEHIRDEGGDMAFPTNISVNSEAAHYTPGTEADRVLHEEDIVKIDIGVHVDGYIGDAAVTVNPAGNHETLVAAAEEALNRVTDLVEPGTTLGAIGDTICSVAEEYGVKPVSNLGGHYLNQFVQHADPSIPNRRTGSDTKLTVGDHFAVEPFMTTGNGKVKEGKNGNIYRYQGGSVRNRYARKALQEIKQFNDLPFTPRWLSLDPAKTRYAMNQLQKANVVKSYGILTEVAGGMVAQAEHSFLVEDDHVIVTTQH